MKINLRKIISFSLMILGFSCVGVAQQEVQYSQFMLNRLSYNPAYAGSSGSICATLMGREQWLGLRIDRPAPGIEAGSKPASATFQFDSPVKFLHGGLGLGVQVDQIGYRQFLNAQLDYAFRIYWGPGNLAAGVEASLNSTSLDYANLVGPDDLTGNWDDPLHSSSDPLLSSSKKEDDMLFDASIGLYYQVPGAYYAGISVKNLLGASSKVLHWQHARNIYIMGGYEYTLPANPSFKLKPAALIKTADFNIKGSQIDLVCLLDYQNVVWGGVGYRVQDAVMFYAGVNWQHIKVGVDYDLTISRLGTFKQGLSAGTAELYLRYCFKVIIPPKPPTVYRNTLYLQ